MAGLRFNDRTMYQLVCFVNLLIERRLVTRRRYPAVDVAEPFSVA
jgi:hypothetical protein